MPSEKSPAVRIQEIVQRSRLKAKRVMELAKSPESPVLKLRMMAGLNQEQAEELVSLLATGSSSTAKASG
jgi:hypothetical protein